MLPRAIGTSHIQPPTSYTNQMCATKKLACTYPAVLCTVAEKYRAHGKIRPRFRTVPWANLKKKIRRINTVTVQNRI